MRRSIHATWQWLRVERGTEVVSTSAPIDDFDRIDLRRESVLTLRDQKYPELSQKIGCQIIERKAHVVVGEQSLEPSNSCLG